MMKPQDVLVLLKISVLGESPWTYAALASSLGISPGEAHNCVQRLVLCGLVTVESSARGRSGTVRVLRAAAVEFLVHGLRYVFPAEIVRMTRGMPTAASAPALEGVLVAPSPPLVWPAATGIVRGQGLVSIYASVPEAAARDRALYDRLALADLLRIGGAREREVGARMLRGALEA